MMPNENHLLISMWTQPCVRRYSTSSFTPTHAMMMKAPSTSAG